jgi:transcriptional regulator with XRE-family HTH domain
LAYEENETAIPKVLGAPLRNLRRKTELSQERFADHCGLDRTYIAEVKRGTRNVSLLINLCRLVGALGAHRAQAWHSALPAR